VIRRTLFLMMLCVLVVATTTTVLAQDNADGIQAGNIELLEFERPLVEYICAGVFLLTALAIGFKPSKRVHDA